MKKILNVQEPLEKALPGGILVEFEALPVLRFKKEQQIRNQR